MRFSRDLSAALLLSISLATTVALSASSTVPQVIGPSTFTLYAGQSTDVGDISVVVKDGAVVVTYTTEGTWTIDQAHLWVGSSLVTLPKTKSGNPVPGQFPYSATPGDPQKISFTIPLTTLGFGCPASDQLFFLAAHAAVSRTGADGTVQRETAWSEGTRFVSKGNWGTYSAFTLGCVEPPVTPEPTTCETAFAYSPEHSTTFTEIFGSPRWGWSNGPLLTGEYLFDLWAGAGQNDLTKGAWAGHVAVRYSDDGQMQVAYLGGAGWKLRETQLYVGVEPLPVDRSGYTVAPGQYGNVHDALGLVSSDVYSVSATGPVHLVAHATVCR